MSRSPASDSEFTKTRHVLTWPVAVALCIAVFGKKLSMRMDRHTTVLNLVANYQDASYDTAHPACVTAFDSMMMMYGGLPLP